jgi:SNF2 family DNA or RNA helicase
MPDAVQVSGSDSDEVKEDRFLSFAEGKIKTLITKPKIGALGLNFQNCAHVGYFPSHSYEAYYQAVRRCWRFGQQKEVVVEVIMTEGERAVMENLRRKADQAAKMFENLVAEMNHAAGIAKRNDYVNAMGVPSWL